MGSMGRSMGTGVDTMDGFTEEQETYALEFMQTNGDIEEAYRRTHKTRGLSKKQLQERAGEYFLKMFGDALRRRWEEQNAIIQRHKRSRQSNDFC